VPLFLLVFFLLARWILDLPEFDANDMKLTSLVSTVTVLGLVGLGLFSFLFGLIGMISALSRGQPGGLAVAGSLVSLVALVLAIFLMIASFRVMNGLQKRVENRAKQKQEVPKLPGK
jgi:hypothetical protein